MANLTLRMGAGSATVNPDAGAHPVASVSLRQALAVVVLACIFLAQLAFGSRHLSLTQDEPSHTMNGYVTLVTADTWAMPEHTHPPLVNAWAALPLLLQPEHPIPQSVPYWGQDFDRFLREITPLLGPVERVAFATRFQIMLLAVVLMALVYRWARDRAGHVAGVVAVAIMTWDPTMMAHAQLNTTDLGVTLFGFACLYLTERLRRGFRWALVVGIGLLLGAAMAAKPSGVFLVPVVAALLIWRARTAGATTEGSPLRMDDDEGNWPARTAGATTEGSPLRTDDEGSGPSAVRAGLRARPRPQPDGRPQRDRPYVWTSLIAVAVAFAVAFVTLWAAYRFEWGPLPGGRMPVPMPSHLQMFSRILGDTMVSFAAGQLRPGGWWWYFPLAFAVKTPIPLIIALAAGLLVALRRRARLAGHASLWAFPLTYLAIAVLSGTNIGYRHLLPVFPFAYVALGSLGARVFEAQDTWRPWVVRGVVAALAVWYVGGTLRVYPFALAYFNELAGGPEGGYRYLVDSNLDWGQSLKALKTTMDAAGIDKVNLAYGGWVDPAEYGVRYTLLPPAISPDASFEARFDPAPGMYAIGATSLQGVGLRNPDLYDWFRHRQPVARPGYGLLVYDVARRDPPAAWVAQCAAPTTPLTGRLIRSGFGREDLRTLEFDCTQSWVYPGGGTVSGWYALLRDTWRRDDGFVHDSLFPTRLSYQSAEMSGAPALALFEWSPDAGRPPTRVRTGALAAPAGSPPGTVEAQGVPVQAPVRLDGPLSFLGYQVAAAQEGGSRALELWTVWRVEDTPRRPLSIMAHLVAGDGSAQSVADGLGVAYDQLRAGDVVVQRHRLVEPRGKRAETYALRIGVYWQEGTILQHVAGRPEADALFALGPWPH